MMFSQIITKWFWPKVTQKKLVVPKSVLCPGPQQCETDYRTKLLGFMCFTVGGVRSPACFRCLTKHTQIKSSRSDVMTVHVDTRHQKSAEKKSSNEKNKAADLIERSLAGRLSFKEKNKRVCEIMILFFLKMNQCCWRLCGGWVWTHTDGNCAECCGVRFSVAGLLTCFADAAEAVLSVVTGFFCGKAQVPDAELALVALQSLAWCQRGGGGGAAQERESGGGEKEQWIYCKQDGIDSNRQQTHAWHLGIVWKNLGQTWYAGWGVKSCSRGFSLNYPYVNTALMWTSIKCTGVDRLKRLYSRQR